MTVEQAQAVIASPFFNAFLEPAADRCACLTSWLSGCGIPHRTVTLQDKTHIVIAYRQAAYDSRFKMKTLIAHYDRDHNSPGANDNSAACVQLLLFAERLLHVKAAHNIRIIFTDGEEAGAGGIRNQGAYRLGQGLRRLAMHHDDIFVFDLCGTGDTLILSESGLYGRDTKKTQALAALHRRCRGYAEAACPGQWLPLPTAYSDNAGLISAGLSAQVFTVLPKAEAVLLRHYLPPQQYPVPCCTDAGISAQHHAAVQKAAGKQSASGTHKQLTAAQTLQHYVISNSPLPEGSPLAAVIPQTWQRMHSPQDSLETLTPQAFILMDKLLNHLAAVKEPVKNK